jgi:hypothetical protein
MILPPFADNSLIKFRGKGVRFTAAPGLTVFEHEIPFDLLTDGLDLLCHANTGDWVTVQAVDKTNIMGYGLVPEGLVLDEFATEWGLLDDSHKAASVHLSYAARLKQGLFLRITYNNTGASDIPVTVNVFRHKTNEPIVF